MAPTPPLDRRHIVVSGPSGVGKGTLIQKLFDTHPDTFSLIVSHTTRKPRPGEVEGVNYFFASASTFSSLIPQNAFVEYAIFNGHYYGTTRQTIAEQTAKGLIAVLDIELQGVRQMKADPSIDARYVFIAPPNLEALEERLRSRGTEDEHAIQGRLAQARVELEYADMQGGHDKVIVNDDLENAYEELDEFIYSTNTVG